MDIDKLKGRTADRLLQLEVEPGVMGEKSYYFSVASEAPVRMPWGDEVLLHRSESVDLSRAKNMAVVWEHGKDPTVGSRPIGKVEQWELRGKKSYCKMRWAKTAIAEELRSLVDDGTISNVSIRYEIHSAKQQGDTILVDRWSPVHVSLVSDPADHTVGIGRAYKSTMEPRNELAMGDTMGTDDEKVISFDAESERAKLRQEESDRIRSIAALCKKHNLSELGDQLIEQGTSIEEARAKVLEKLERSYNASPLGAPLGDPTLPGFDKNDDKRYSLLNALRSICPGFSEYQKNCFEREVSEEIGRKLGKTTAGVYIPVRHLTLNKTGDRDIFNTAATAYGGQLVDTELRSQDFIEALRNKAMVFQLGARFLTGLQGNVEIPKQTSVSSTYWVGENGTIPETDFTFGQIGLTPKNIVSRMTMTRQLMLQSSLSAENLIREDMVKQIALGIDRAAIYGSGTNNEPRGILNYSINSLSSGLSADGTAPSYANLVNLCAAIESDNADISVMKWLTNPKVKAKLMLTPMQTSGVEGNFVLKDGSSMLGYSFNSSNQVPSNLTKGNGTNLSALILGCWDQLIVGEWGVLEVLPNIYGKTYESGGVEIRAIKTLDMALRHEQSFAALTDVITT